MSSEPAAWGVLRVGGGWVSILANEVQAETSRKSWDERENWVHEVIQLYRQPTLTDEEREAVEWCVEMAVVHATECDEEIATLRSLLERFA